MLDDFEAAIDSSNIDAINRLQATFSPILARKTTRFVREEITWVLILLLITQWHQFIRELFSDFKCLVFSAPLQSTNKEDKKTKRRLKPI